MSFDDLYERIRKILEFVETLPEPYRLKTYELLLASEMRLSESAQLSMIRKAKPAELTAEYSIPIDVRAFLAQYSIPESALVKLFFMTGMEIKPIYRIDSEKKSKAQIQVACLAALENALKGGKFEFSIEDVRQRTKEHKCYDRPNFIANFKNSQGLFKDLSDGEHVELSPDGKTELADTITEISK